MMKILLTVEMILLMVLLILELFILLTRNNKNPKKIVKSNFDEDMKFLNYIINFYIDDFISIDMKSKKKDIKSKSFSLVNQEDIIDYAVRITDQIIDTISDDYKNLLSLYFSDYESFIINRVVSFLIRYNSEINTKIITNNNKS